MSTYKFCGGTCPQCPLVPPPMHSNIIHIEDMASVTGLVVIHTPNMEAASNMQPLYLPADISQSSLFQKPSLPLCVTTPMASVKLH